MPGREYHRAFRVLFSIYSTQTKQRLPRTYSKSSRLPRSDSTKVKVRYRTGKVWGRLKDESTLHLLLVRSFSSMRRDCSLRLAWCTQNMAFRLAALDRFWDYVRSNRVVFDLNVCSPQLNRQHFGVRFALLFPSRAVDETTLFVDYSGVHSTDIRCLCFSSWKLK